MIYVDHLLQANAIYNTTIGSGSHDPLEFSTLLALPGHCISRGYAMTVLLKNTSFQIIGECIDSEYLRDFHVILSIFAMLGLIRGESYNTIQTQFVYCMKTYKL